MSRQYVIRPAKQEDCGAILGLLQELTDLMNVPDKTSLTVKGNRVITSFTIFYLVWLSVFIVGRVEG